MAMDLEGKIRRPRTEFDDERIRYEHRFAPLGQVSTPPLVPYMQFKEMTRVIYIYILRDLLVFFVLRSVWRGWRSRACFMVISASRPMLTVSGFFSSCCLVLLYRLAVGIQCSRGKQGVSRIVALCDSLSTFSSSCHHSNGTLGSIQRRKCNYHVFFPFHFSSWPLPRRFFY